MLASGLLLFRPVWSTAAALAVAASSPDLSDDLLPSSSAAPVAERGQLERVGGRRPSLVLQERHQPQHASDQRLAAEVTLDQGPGQDAAGRGAARGDQASSCSKRAPELPPQASK